MRDYHERGVSGQAVLQMYRKSHTQIPESDLRTMLLEEGFDMREAQPAVKAETKPEFSFFDSPDQIQNAEPVAFLVNGIIPKNRYTGFVALSGARKTIIACNLVRSVLMGEPFLSKFPVDCTPERVLLFAAESARSELKERVEKMDLVPFLQSGKLLIRSASTDGPFHQDDLPESLLSGSLCIFDTFIRFFDGMSEQDSTEARKFSKQMQRIVNAGATVIVLFHAPKGARKADVMTIESIRGSTELGASMACCWGLTMLGPNWEDLTRMEQVKRREFQADPAVFDFSCARETAICTYVDSGIKLVGTAARTAEDAQALEYLKAHLDWTDRAISKQFKAETGIDRSYKWFQRHR
jgi:RecA-family ATPase